MKDCIKSNFQEINKKLNLHYRESVADFFSGVTSFVFRINIMENKSINLYITITCYKIIVDHIFVLENLI